MKLRTLSKVAFMPILLVYFVEWVLQIEPSYRPREGGEDLTGILFLFLPFIGGVLFTFSFVVTELLTFIFGRISHKKVVSEVKMLIIATLFTALSAPLLILFWPNVISDMR